MDILGSSVSKIGGTLTSGLTNTVAVQVQNSIENAVTVSRAVYQSLGLVNKPTPLDVKHEFASLTATIDQATSALTVFPADSAQGDHVLGIAPKGVALCAALARTTAALKSLPGPVSQEDGVALLNSYEEVEAKTIILFPAVNARVGSVEHGAPGLVDHGLNRLKELFQELAEALSAVLPPTLNQEKAQGLHTSIQTRIESSSAHFRGLKA